MRLLPGNRRRGVALVITLSVIALLVSVSLELNRQIRASVTSSACYRDVAALRHMIRSGVSLAESVLARDKQNTEVDSIQEDWADQEKINSYISGLDIKGDLEIRISDELSRIQVNALVDFPDGRNFNKKQHRLWLRFISLILSRQEETGEKFLAEPIEPAAIVNPVKDWLDSGDDETVTGLTGAENDYYQDLYPPCTCRNGPVRHINELLLVRGITPEIFYSSEEAETGISKYITVYGMQESQTGFSYPGKININTADVPVLAGILPEGREFLAPEIASFREEKEGDSYIYDLTEPEWYKQVPGCSDLEIDEDLITLKSDIFRIECLASLHGIKKSARVIVERTREAESGKWTCRVLSWRYE